MIHPNTEVRYINEEKGRGLFATQVIPKGTITWVLDEIDREITPTDLKRYDQRFQDILLTYSFRNKQGNYIFCWDNGRFINHSFNANCCLTAYNLEVAIRDISAGEEITDDYGYLNIIEPFTASPEGGERTIVYPDDLLHYAEMWDDRLRQAFPELLKVHQPLQYYLPAGMWQSLSEISTGKQPLESIRSCFFEGAGHYAR